MIKDIADIILKEIDSADLELQDFKRLVKDIVEAHNKANKPLELYTAVQMEQMIREKIYRVEALSKLPTRIQAIKREIFNNKSYLYSTKAMRDIVDGND